jgi:hypothetical protein
MALGDAATEQHLPFPYDRVFDALIAALPETGFAVRSQDRVIGRVTASAGMSAFSYGENMSVQVRRIDDQSCVLILQSNLKVAANWGGASKNAKNAERIISAVSARLQGLPSPFVGVPEDPPDGPAPQPAPPQAPRPPAAQYAGMPVYMIVILAVLAVSAGVFALFN